MRGTSMQEAATPDMRDAVVVSWTPFAGDEIGKLPLPLHLDVAYLVDTYSICICRGVFAWPTFQAPINPFVFLWSSGVAAVSTWKSLPNHSLPIGSAGTNQRFAQISRHRRASAWSEAFQRTLQGGAGLGECCEPHRAGRLDRCRATWPVTYININTVYI